MTTHATEHPLPGTSPIHLIPVNITADPEEYAVSKQRLTMNAMNRGFAAPLTAPHKLKHSLQTLEF